MIVLPDKYYLSHAHELFSAVASNCEHLLDENHTAFLSRFRQLNENEQCLLVRLLTRKPDIISIDSLNYPELESLEIAIDKLIKAGFVRYTSRSDLQSFLPILTKSQLLDLLCGAPAMKRSMKKSELLELAQKKKWKNDAGLDKLLGSHLVKNCLTETDYIFFLFFGDLKSRFQRFVMRDLGVLKTRNTKKQLTPRFDTLEEAKSNYQVLKLRQRFLENKAANFEAVSAVVITLKVNGLAAQHKDKLLFELGEYIQPNFPETAIELWQQSDDPRAFEKSIRCRYQMGEREQLEQELIELKSQAIAAVNKIFVEDFYARKFQGKRTSVYTDMLRESNHCIALDEGFLGQVEEGVIQRYNQQGVQAYFAENKLWRVLFAFTFWDILYGDSAPQHSEFDYLPPALKSSDFYVLNKVQIEQRLSELQQTDTFMQSLTKIATSHFGFPTGLFRWTANLLEMIKTFVINADSKATAVLLRTMAEDFQHARDGYPDLMVYDGQGLRFEELKSPGDVLRPNQLVSIQRMRSAGFIVDITQVQWAVDPLQKYAVVDIETTGSGKGLHAITEIAVVTVQNGEVINQWSSLINPQRHIPAYITKLTGIHDHMVKNAPIFSEVAEELSEQLKDAIFVAHNVGFDYGFIREAYAELGQSFKRPKICTVQASRKSFPKLKSYSLGNLASYFDLDLKTAHRALSDAKATAQLLCLIQTQAEINRAAVN